MHREFTIDLADNQVDYLNRLLPQGNSFQIFQKAQRRRKAQKKLDHMYVAQFSLRPVKKIKTENQTHQSKKQSSPLQNQESQFHQAFSNLNLHIKNTSIPKEYQKEAEYSKQQSMKQQRRPSQIEQMPQIIERHTSRSQRVSKPTRAYLQFQQETFKKIIVEKVDYKVPPKISSNTQEHIQKQKINTLEEAQLKQDIRNCSKQKIGLSKQESECKQKQPLIQKNEGEQKQIQNQVKVNFNPGLNQQCRDSMVSNRKQNILSDLQNEESHKSHASEKVQKSIALHRQVDQLEFIKSSQKYIGDEVKLNGNYQSSSSRKDEQVFKDKHAKLIVKPLQQSLMLKKCWSILQKLKNHKASWPFRHPVDPEGQGVPDYFEKIRQPMDLKTIEKKLRGSKYKVDYDFYDDIFLMFRNSFQFNPSTSKYYKLTTELSEYFNQVKSKSYPPKLSGKHSIKDEERSDYEAEEYEKQDKKGEEKYEKEKDESEQRNLQRQKWKRSASLLQCEQSNHTKDRKIAKVFITNEGPTRKEHQKQRDDRQAKRPNSSISNSVNLNQIKSKTSQQVNRSTQIIQIDEKNLDKPATQQIKPVKIELIKKQSNTQNIAADKTDILRHSATTRQSEPKFGYPQESITVTQREVLLYDILHINSPQIRNQIEQFLTKNHHLYHKFSKGQNTQFFSQKFNNNQQQAMQKGEIKLQEQFGDSYEFQLKDLDLLSYKALREQVDRLIKLDTQNS